MIGDSAADMSMARTAGAAGCIGVTWGWPTPMILEADVLINDFDQIQVWPT
jgi:phosphoglycolate phosphatase